MNRLELEGTVCRAPDVRYSAAGIVITSYSIHYTKLYDDHLFGQGFPRGRRKFESNGVVDRLFLEMRLRIESLQQLEQQAPGRLMRCITSFQSIFEATGKSYNFV